MVFNPVVAYMIGDRPLIGYFRNDDIVVLISANVHTGTLIETPGSSDY